MYARLVSPAVAALLTVTLSAGAQQPAAPRASVGDTSIFAPLDPAPAPSMYRASGGGPGPKYWQNRADYALRATLDTAAKRLDGAMTLRYTNYSPDTLTFLWLQTEQNAFRPGSLNALITPQEGRSGARGFAGGDVIDRFVQRVGGKAVALALTDNGTVTRVDLARPLAPGETAMLDAAWHFVVPEHGADRMGRDGALYEIAQWYPRLCVYDDVRGWNTEPYVGPGEFYLEYGDYTLDVTLPAGYVVAATGSLTNPRDVLTPAQIARLAKAAKSDTPVAIITAGELTSGAARPRKTGTLTWKFAARNVRDVAWAASPDYLWDASSWKGILAQSYYRPTAATVWGNGEAADQARASIEEFSTRWFPYPYPQITAVEGPVYGMEYPMLAMEANTPDKFALFRVITHEVGHNWFPMIVGSNERVHTWMDEGFNTFIDTYSEARRYPERGDQAARIGMRDDFARFEVPVDLPNDRITQQQSGFGQYAKTAAGLQLLRREILGPAVFDTAFKTYIRRWAYKHPTPADFWRTMENVSGRRLDWFWREWFVENAQFDQSVDSVVVQLSGDTVRAGVLYGNHARGVLPILARFTFADGTTQDVAYPAEVWSTNSRNYARWYTFVGKRPVRVELDPDHRLVDVNRDNNTRTFAAP